MFSPNRFYTRRPASGFNPSSIASEVWLDARNATYLATVLTAIPNSGAAGGTPSIVGVINAGATLGGMPTMRIDATSKQINLSQPAWGAGGTMWAFWYGACLSASGDRGIIGKGWPGAAGGGAIAAYQGTGGGTSVFFGNGCCSVDATTQPCFSRANVIGDTAEHAIYMLWDAGGNAVYVDGSSLSIAGTTFPAAVPNYGATTWNYGVAQSGAESINSDCGVWMTGKTALTGTEITNLTNFYMNL